jgi:hypothetical protein
MKYDRTRMVNCRHSHQTAQEYAQELKQRAEELQRVLEQTAFDIEALHSPDRILKKIRAAIDKAREKV